MVQSLFGAVFRRELISADECARLLAHAAAREWQPARVTDGRGGGTTQGAKRASWQLVALAPETEWLFARLAEFLGTDVSYGFDLREIESPLKLQRYEVGDHHGWHVDLAGPGCRERKLGITVQLSDGDTYEGGELHIYDPPQHAAAPRERGCAIAFPAYVPHEVAPVTRGVRYALTAWVLGPPFR